MSHFSVLVIGKDWERQLEGYNENIEVPRYAKYTKGELIEKGRKNIEDFKQGTYAQYLKDPETYEAKCANSAHMDYVKNEFPLKLNWTDEEVYVNELRWYDEDEIGEDGEVYSTYNPESRWDWYQIGGRFRDEFSIKDGAEGLKGPEMEKFIGTLYAASKGGYADCARKKDIDWSKIHQNKKHYDKAIRFWELKVEGKKPTAKEKNEVKFDFYQPSYYLERYGTKENYAQCMSSFSTWAVVKDGKWYEKGEMGYWACSDETHDEAVEWDLKFYERFIEPLFPGILLTIVDCHI